MSEDAPERRFAVVEGERTACYVVGEKMMTKEPNAFVTRSDDREFSDAVNWALQALIWGEEQGLTKDLTLCAEIVVTSIHIKCQTWIL